MESLKGLAVHEAASTGDYDTLVDLVKSGDYDINLADEDYGFKTPLHWACAKGYVECARFLLENGARGNARTETGWTPAHFAAEAGKLSVLRALHTANVAIDKKDNYGCTARRMAEIYGRQDCVKFLEQAERELAQRRQKPGNVELSDDEEHRKAVSSFLLREKSKDNKKKKDAKKKKSRGVKKQLKSD